MIMITTIRWIRINIKRNIIPVRKIGNITLMKVSIELINIMKMNPEIKRVQKNNVRICKIESTLANIYPNLDQKSGYKSSINILKEFEKQQYYVINQFAILGYKMNARFNLTNAISKLSITSNFS